MSQIYKEMTSEEIDILNEIIGSRVKSHIMISNRSITNHRPWLAIFAPHLNALDKTLMLRSTRYYYKQYDLDMNWPTNPEKRDICSPFNRSGSNSEYEIMFIDTSTGAKIYEYATALCKANQGYIDRQSLAVSLTKSKTHKVKIVHLNNTVWVLSNDINDDFIQNTLALFPFLFGIQDLQNDEEVIKCCQAVTKDQSIKPFFKNIFDSLADVRKQKKINIIKSALNARISDAITRAERDISHDKEYIKDYEERLQQYYDRLEQHLAEKLGYESKEKAKDEDVTDILDFVDRNRFIQNLNILKINNYGNPAEYLQLDIWAPITIYETEPLERQINNRITEYNQNDLQSKILKAFKRIFIDEELQMICQTFVKIDMISANINGSKDANRKQYSDYQRLPQPHLTRYDCWGDNRNAIIQALKESDLVGAMNNILIAAQNINFVDSTVLSSWLETIAYSNYLYNLPTCLSKADGRLWSIKDVVEQLEREENNSEEVIGHPELTDEVPNF